MAPLPSWYWISCPPLKGLWSGPVFLNYRHATLRSRGDHLIEVAGANFEVGDRLEITWNRKTSTSVVDGKVVNGPPVNDIREDPLLEQVLGVQVDTGLSGPLGRDLGRGECTGGEGGQRIPFCLK